MNRLMGVVFIVALAGIARAQDAGRLTEVVPTSRQRGVTWRYTTERPAGDWAKPGFNDGNWATAPGPFGAPNTPGITPRTRWTSGDIWLRREVTIPAGADVAALQFLVFHDEDVEIFVNGIPAARDGGFITSYETLDILPAARAVLKPGATLLLAVHCHQTAGGQGIDVGLATVPPGYSERRAAARRRDEYRRFALSHRGDAANGQRLFQNEQRLACARCHTTDGSGSKAGPDLHAAGDAFSRRALADAVLAPSANIAVGYGTTVIKSKAGEVYDGVVKDAGADGSVSIMGADGKLVRLAADQIALRRTTDLSLMPEGLESGLSQQEFTDLVEYLASLKLPQNLVAVRRGMPAEIPELRPPVPVVPFCSEEHRFEHPCAMVALPGTSGVFLVCEQDSGKIWLLDKGGGGERKTLFADCSAEIRRGPADGLLGIALHPKFRENRRYFIQHERVLADGKLYALVSERIASPDSRTDSGRPSRTIIQFPCTTQDHVGGGVEFGPDGMLYIGMGDTGPQQDPQGHGQDVSLMLGKMLRIDVDRADGDQAYAVPADNPFVGVAGVRPEIWALGFREPWRFSFDPATGDLWVGDVGQDTYEEVSIVRRGENHGWNVYEGFEPFSSRYRRPGATYTPPVFAYDRRFGNSITGGHVYRADTKSPFYGAYLCGDYTSRRIWAITQKDRALESVRQVAAAPERITSFARDEQGQLYVVGYEGMIFRLDLSGPPGSN
jgi:putative heme-binding domain-containing protein